MLPNFGVSNNLTSAPYERCKMGLVILLALLVLLFFGLGFTIHLLWIIAVVLFLVWIIGFFVRGIEGRGRWYRRW